MWSTGKEVNGTAGGDLEEEEEEWYIPRHPDSIGGNADVRCCADGAAGRLDGWCGE